MKTRLMFFVAALAFVLGAGRASAATVALSFDPAPIAVTAGSTFSVGVVAQIPLDQTDGGLVGWGFTLEFDDSQMALQDVTAGPLWDLVFWPTTTTPLDPLVALFQASPTSPPEGAWGPNVLLATLTFWCTTPGTGVLDIAVADPTTDPTQGFVNAFNFDQPYMAWTSEPATITQRVPEPAGLALFLTTLGVASWTRRRCRAVQRTVHR